MARNGIHADPPIGIRYAVLDSHLVVITYYIKGLAMLDGYVYAVGGWEGSSRLDSVEKYDPETNTWSPVASLKMAVTSPAVVAHEGK